ncbi:MAG: hypothetical protein AAF570_27140, partial [Bacteroidota bacterium]
DDLELLAADATFYGVPDIDTTGDDANIQVGSVLVNYYPGYKTYLYVDTTAGLQESNILPAAGEGYRQTFLGAKTLDTALSYTSAVTAPRIVNAQEIQAPVAPGIPQGGDYATRPDFYGKSSYTFKVDYLDGEQPFAMAFFRTNEDMLLQALYKPETYRELKIALNNLRENEDAYYANRWRNLLRLDYEYVAGHPDEAFSTGSDHGEFLYFPDSSGFRFPPIDNENIVSVGASLFPGAMTSTEETAFHDAIFDSFLPLTEQPLLYQYIEDVTYQPIRKPQRLRNTAGQLLAPTDSEFAQAPMARRLSDDPVSIEFTDFTLDGSANNVYFYAGRGLSNQLQLSTWSPIAGPVYLINATPPETPQLRKVTTQIADPVTSLPTAVCFEMNGYSSRQK